MRVNHRNGRHERAGNEEVVIVLGQGMNNVGSLAKTIQEELLQVGVEVDENLQAVFDKVGKETAEELRKTSPENEKGKHRGRYRKGWVYERGLKRAGSRYKAGGVVRNKTDPQLTHLLEYGHPIVRRGKVVGYSDPKEHINEAAKNAAAKLEEQIPRTILNKSIGG